MLLCILEADVGLSTIRKDSQARPGPGSEGIDLYGKQSGELVHSGAFVG